MADILAALKEHIGTIKSLGDTAALLGWDQRTYMPEGGMEARGQQLSAVSKVAHELFTSARTVELLNAAEQLDLDPDSDDARLIAYMRYDYTRALKLPAEFVGRRSIVRMRANGAWQKARTEQDWKIFEPAMQEVLELSQEQAELYGYSEHIYDPLLDVYERGTTTAEIQQLFQELRTHTVPLVKAIAEQNTPHRTACLYGSFDESAQETFARDVITHYGYDWSRGRLDRTIHPFCTNFGRTDVRITTRFDPEYIGLALFGTLHESGHALYEQGISPSLERTPLERGASLGIHESQSRLWENLVGRSREFWNFFYPRLQGHFPEHFGKVDFNTFYQAINTINPSLIRIKADEITYNLHIMLRFELEVAMLEGTLAVKDLPAAWNAKMEEYLGVQPSNHVEGVLQDIHWSNGSLGYFPTYTLGNVLSVQFYNEALKAHPEIPRNMSEGRFDTLHEWLRSNIYQHGRKYTPREIVQRVTGGSINAQPYIDYLKQKFSDVYDLGAQA